jgi:hypothetical protein
MNNLKKVMYNFLVIVGFSLAALSCTTAEKNTSVADEPQINKEEALSLIKSKMGIQEEAWNTGDLNGFMQSYWQSDSLLFLGKSGISFGWQTTLDNYVKGYSSPEEMGQLTFENEVIRFIDIKTVQVIGKWHLKRTGDLDNLEGHYSLIWKKKKGNWVIISDHSS